MNTKSHLSAKYWIVLIVGFLSTSISYVPNVGHSTQIESMMDQFHVNYSQIGLLDSLASFTAGLVILVSGMIMYRWGARNIAIIGFIIAIIAQILFAVAATFPLLIMVRLLMGVGIGMIFVAPYNMTIRWFEQTDHTAFALGVMLAADGAGMLIALYLLAFIYMASSWFVGTFVGAIFIAVVFVLVLIFLKEPDTWEEEKKFQAENKIPLGQQIREIYLNRNVVGTCIYISQSWGNTLTAAYWIPAALMEYAGWSESTSGLVGSLFALAGILSLVVGLITDKMAKKKPPMIVCSLAAAVAYLLLTIGFGTGHYLMVAVMLVIGGIFAYSGLLQGYNLVTDALGPYKGGVGTSFVLAFGFLIGGFVYPLIIGFFRDLTGSYMTGFITLTIAVTLCGLGGALITKDVPPEERPEF